MNTFETTSEQYLASVVKDKKELKLEISGEITEFGKHIPKVDFSEPLEIPPSSVIYSPEMAAQILVCGGNDQKGKYIRLVASVYWCKGKIFYRELAPARYELHIVWPEV